MSSSTSDPTPTSSSTSDPNPLVANGAPSVAETQQIMDPSPGTQQSVQVDAIDVVEGVDKGKGKGKGKQVKEKAKEKNKQLKTEADDEAEVAPPLRRLPGFNLPLNYYEKALRLANARLGPNHQHFFPSALNPNDIVSLRSTQPLLTLRELSMLRIMNELTEKPNWEEKVFNPEITTKWKSEMTSTPLTPTVSPQMAEYIIAELQHAARWYTHTGHITVFNTVVKSDTALPASFMEEMQAAIKPLEDVPPHLQDWHPGSGGKVLDLVHPSLFPLVYGKTRALAAPDRVPLLQAASYTGKGDVLPVPTISDTRTLGDVLHDVSHLAELTNRAAYSTRFQWLPCEVSFVTPSPGASSSASSASAAAAAGEAGEVKPVITSYINNLHPERHADVYKLVERVIDAALPMWDKALQGVLEGLGGRERVRKTRIEYDGMYVGRVVQPEPGTFVPGTLPPVTTTAEVETTEGTANSTEAAAGERVEEASSTSRSKESAKKKKPKKDKTPPPVVVNLRKKFRRQGLQVIVKFANIELTPEKPTYDGGSWHLEGQLNENICASALYYYSSHNITPSTLAFQQQSDTMPADVIAMPDGFLPAIYGGTQHDSGVQLLGGVRTPPGRLLVFPNVLQHQVQPFALEDKAQRGWRKLLAVFLVDPNVRIVSTRYVPPQRRDWWVDEMRVGSVGGLGGLPVEIRDEVFGHLDFPIGMDEAREVREELMDERKDFEVRYDKSFNSVKFSLCEH